LDEVEVLASVLRWHPGCVAADLDALVTLSCVDVTEAGARSAGLSFCGLIALFATLVV
jgi:hypothetical protein